MKGSTTTSIVSSLGITLGLIGCTFGPSEVEVHPDDLQHPLSLYPNSGLSGLAHPDDVKDGDTWNGMFGSFLPCVAQGEGPLEITGVDWESSPGLEPLSVSTYVRTVAIGDENTIGQLYGTPEEPLHSKTPPFHEEFVKLSVDRPCHKAGDPPVNGHFDEIVFSVEGKSSGAHLTDIRFTYTTPDGKQHIVENDWDFYLCGPKVPDETGCR